MRICSSIKLQQRRRFFPSSRCTNSNYTNRLSLSLRQVRTNEVPLCTEKKKATSLPLEKEERRKRGKRCVRLPRCVLLPGELVAGEWFPLGAFFFLETIHRRKQRLEFRRAGGVAVRPVAPRRVLGRAGWFLWRATRKFRRSWLPRLRVLAVARRHGPRVIRERRCLVRDVGRVRVVARRLSRRQQPTHVSFYGRI